MTKKAIRHQMIWAEMARRKMQFHTSEPWEQIRLWGLFSWGDVSDLLKSGDLLTNMEKANRTIWAWPSTEAYSKHIEPLLSKPLEEVAKLAGW